MFPFFLAKFGFGEVRMAKSVIPPAHKLEFIICCSVEKFKEYGFGLSKKVAKRNVMCTLVCIGVEVTFPPRRRMRCWPDFGKFQLTSWAVQHSAMSPITAGKPSERDREQMNFVFRSVLSLPRVRRRKEWHFRRMKSGKQKVTVILAKASCTNPDISVNCNYRLSSYTV